MITLLIYEIVGESTEVGDIPLISTPIHKS